MKTLILTAIIALSFSTVASAKQNSEVPCPAKDAGQRKSGKDIKAKEVKKAKTETNTVTNG